MQDARLRRVVRPLAKILTLLLVTGVWLAMTSTGTAAPGAGTSPVISTSDLGRVTSHVSGTTSDGRHVRGTFTPSAFSVVGGQLVSTGTLDLVLRGHGKPQLVHDQVTVPVRSINGTSLAGLAAAPTATASCKVLHLDLGPLDLNLLGLQVHLDEVVLDIAAQPGPGNLLGNLLCAVAGLLDGGSPISGLLDQISGLLTQILAALNL